PAFQVPRLYSIVNSTELQELSLVCKGTGCHKALFGACFRNKRFGIRKDTFIAWRFRLFVKTSIFSRPVPVGALALRTNTRFLILVTRNPLVTAALTPKPP